MGLHRWRKKSSGIDGMNIKGSRCIKDMKHQGSSGLLLG